MDLLAGIKVLDLSRILAGPWATMCLADYGAEVWKIERPGLGDDTRQWGPPYLATADGGRGPSAYFLSCNRGKHSLALDLGHAEGRALVARLAARADVLVENFKVGALARYGLDHATLAARHPRLVYCSISGFGQTGPDAGLAGYDAMVQARGGLMSLTGVPDGEPGAGPQKVGVAVADLMCGMYAASAILAALLRCQREGRGCHIDLGLLDSQVAWLANQGLNLQVGGSVPGRLGTAHPNIVPYQAFATADGHLMLAVGNDRQFASLCALAGAAELALDPRYASNAARVAHREQVVGLVAGWLRQRRSAEWQALLGAAGVPCGPIQSLDQVFADPQVQARGVPAQLEHPRLGSLPQLANPVHFDGGPATLAAKPPPQLGEDTAAVLQRELGLAPSEIEGLRALGAIG